MLIHINVTSERAYSDITEKNTELFFKLFSWCLFPHLPMVKDIDPREIFGHKNTIPLIKFSTDEELGGYENCDEWQINVSSIKIASAALRAYELMFIYADKSDTSKKPYFYITVGTQN